MVDTVVREFGRIDIVVNNAGVFRHHPLDELTYADWQMAWRAMLDINLVGPANVCYCAARHMIAQGGGRIINVSSGAADANLEGASAYNASKAALERFSGTLAAEVAETDIQVTTFRPGTVDTQMQADIRQTPTDFFPKADLFQSFYDKGELLSPDDPAQAILWLASRFAADSNGQRFDIQDDTFRQRFAADLGLTLETATDLIAVNGK
jgi:NAD(P)-dependent dehydrogenase (short-subunit alcohol dehydrogenase family)